MRRPVTELTQLSAAAQIIESSRNDPALQKADCTVLVLVRTFGCFVSS